MRVPLLVLSLAVLAGPIGAQEPTDSAAPVPATGYGAWFGSIPNMTLSTVGIMLDGVTPESPAAKAGLAQGDLITRMGDKTVENLRDMVTVLRAHAPGDTLQVVFWRDAEAQEYVVKVVLGTRPRS